MSTKKLLKTLFNILGEDVNDYFITGSLSFLPLFKNYRKPGKDIDIFINKNIFDKKKDLFKNAGIYHNLRLREVAVANTSIVSKIISPKVGFIHVDTKDGLLDISLYKEKNETIEMLFGMGFVFEFSRELLKRERTLHYEGISYKCLPMEFMFITKSVEYIKSFNNGKLEEFKKTKHYEDIHKMADEINWNFIEMFLNSMKVKWMGRELPKCIETKINPYKNIDIKRLRKMLIKI